MNTEERRHVLSLSEEQLDEIAQRAANRAFEMIYQEIGRGVIKRLYWGVGVTVVAVLMWLGANHVRLQ